MTRDTIAIREGLTASFVSEGDGADSRKHLWLAGMDDSGRPFRVDLYGWPGRGRAFDEAPLNRIIELMDLMTSPDEPCPVCGRFEAAP